MSELWTLERWNFSNDIKVFIEKFYKLYLILETYRAALV